MDAVQVAVSEYPFDSAIAAASATDEFTAASADAMARAARDAATILGVHWALSWAYTAGLVLAMRGAPGRAAACSWHFLGMKLAHLAASIAATARMPAMWGWSLAFALEMLLLTG